MKKIEVKKQGRQWGIYVDGELFEGGFFSKAAAIDSAGQLRKSLENELEEHFPCEVSISDIMEAFNDLPLEIRKRIGRLL